jgi:hypothetical protein
MCAGVATAALVLLASSVFAQGAPIDPRCAKLLPVATAEQLTKTSPLVLMPQNQVPAAGGSCNYATKDQKVFFTVTLDVQTKAERVPRQFNVYKSGLGYTGTVEPVNGIGEEAFANANGVVLRKGMTIVAIQNDIVAPPGTPKPAPAVLLEVARSIAGKL